MTEVAIMPLAAEKAADGSEGAPILLMEDRGMWLQTSAPTGKTLAATRAGLKAAVCDAIRNVNDEPDVVVGLEGLALSLYLDLVGSEVHEALTAARESADDAPPLLRLHLAPEHEWVPWELLHDGTDFLGLSFRIARLPVIKDPPRMPLDGLHPVSVIRSILGKRVATPDEAEFGAWRDTFADVVGPGVQALEVPPQGNDALWPEVAALRDEADILHVTCHGMRDDHENPYWALDPDTTTLRYRFNASQFNSLRPAFAKRKPLVFANACTLDAYTGPERPPLGADVFGLGALNVIGTLAPIRRALALRFAKQFYKLLLGEGQDVASALLNTKRAIDADAGARSDPTYLLYCLYGPPETHYTSNGAG